MSTTSIPSLNSGRISSWTSAVRDHRVWAQSRGLQASAPCLPPSRRRRCLPCCGRCGPVPHWRLTRRRRVRTAVSHCRFEELNVMKWFDCFGRVLLTHGLCVTILNRRLVREVEGDDISIRLQNLLQHFKYSHNGDPDRKYYRPSN